MLRLPHRILEQSKAVTLGSKGKSPPEVAGGIGQHNQCPAETKRRHALGRRTPYERNDAAESVKAQGTGMNSYDLTIGLMPASKFQRHIFFRLA